MRVKELRALSKTELEEKLGKSREELFTLRFQHTTAQLEKTSKLPLTRKTVARILTVLKEREKGA